MDGKKEYTPHWVDRVMPTNRAEILVSDTTKNDIYGNEEEADDEDFGVLSLVVILEQILFLDLLVYANVVMSTLYCPL